jgi:hypothetical protein
MEFKFLPEAVKHILNLPEGTEPDFVLRGSGGLGGNPGESYVILSTGSVFIFERKFGDRSFNRIHIDLSDPALQMELRNDKFSSVLNIGGSMVKLSSFEAGTASLLIETAEEFKRQAQPEQEIEPNPYLLLLMMLIDLSARSDKEGRFTPAAEYFIVHGVCSGNRKMVACAKALYERGCLDEVFQSLALNDEQKRCILANMLEMSMHDGEFSGQEQELVHEAAAKLNIDKEDFSRIWNVILDKNCLSILTDG